MNAPAKINAALIARGLPPMDGYCTCSACGAEDLDRDQVRNGFCLSCLDDAAGYGAESLRNRADQETIETHFDYVRGKRVQS